MNANQFTIIVAGAATIAEALAQTGQFGAVLSLSSTSELKNLIASRQLTPGVADKIFIFADTVTDDTPPTKLPGLISRLTGSGGRVIVAAATPAGNDIVTQCPGAGLLSGDLHVNTILGAIAGLNGVENVRAVNDHANHRVEMAMPTVPNFGQQNPAQAQQPAGGNPFSGFQPGNPTPQQPQAPQQPHNAPNRFGINYAEEPAPQQYQQPAQHTQPAPSQPAWQNPPSGYGENNRNVFDQNTTDWSTQAPASRPGTEQSAPARLGKVIVVTAPKGGTGKSTLSLNAAALLGMALRGTGKNVCIVDANVQQADTGKYIAAHQPSIVDLLADVSQIHPDRITNFLHHKPQLNLSVLIGPSEPVVGHPVHFSGRRYAEIIEALKPNYDYIIVDTPVAELYHEMFRLFALPYADYLLVCVAPNNTTVYNTYLWLKSITAKPAAGGMGFDDDKIGIVLNRAEDDIGCDESVVEDQLRDWDYIGAIPETKEWKKANNEHRLVVVDNLPDINTAISLIMQKATGEQLVDANATAKLAAAGSTKGLLRRLFNRKGAHA